MVLYSAILYMRMDINKEIGQRIKATRLERKLSREQIARRIGTTQQTVEKYEKGKIDISVRRLTQISNVLNVGITHFLKDEKAFKHYVGLQVNTLSSRKDV